MNASLKPVIAAIVDEFGQSCPLASSFPSAVHCLVKHQDSFEEAMINNARAGGDNAGRAGLVGAWLGAFLGIEGVPRKWRDRLAANEQIASAAKRLITNTVRTAV
jgi:ADP-ribosylglycohydrolase